MQPKQQDYDNVQAHAVFAFMKLFTSREFMNASGFSFFNVTHLRTSYVLTGTVGVWQVLGEARETNGAMLSADIKFALNQDVEDVCTIVPMPGQKFVVSCINARGARSTVQVHYDEKSQFFVDGHLVEI